MNNIELDITQPKYATKDKPIEGRVETRVLGDLDGVFRHFSNLWYRARRNVRYVANDQWDDAEKVALKRQRRYPFVWNKIKPIIDSICGTQIQTRMDVTTLPQEMGDERVAEVANRMIKWAEQMNSISDLESKIFEGGLIQAYGVSQVRWVFEDFECGFPKVEKIPPNQFVWDLNAVQEDLTDCRWQARIIPMQRAEAKEMLPKYADFVDMAPIIGQNYGIWENLTKAQRDNDNKYAQDRDRNLVFVTEHYERIRKTTYLVVDSINDAQEIFDNEADANDYYQGVLAVHTNALDPLSTPEGNDTIFIQPLQRDVYIQTILIGNTAVQQVETELPAFPYQVFFSNFIDGECWAYVDGMISAQKFLNRMISEQDNILARGTKGLLTVIEGLLPKGWDAARVQRERGVPGKVIPIMRSGAIEPVQSPPVPFEFGNLAGMTAQHIIEMGGGNNILGGSDNAAESGKTVRAKQAAAGLGRVKLFNSLRAWRKQVSEMMLWQMKEYMDEGQTIRIIGTDNDVEYMKIDKYVIDSLREVRTDIFVTSAVESDIAREETYNQILQFLQTGAGAALDSMTQMSLLLEMNPSLPRDIKKKIMNQSQQFQAFQQWQAQQAEQQKMVQDVSKSLERENIKGLMQGGILSYEQGMQAVNGQQQPNQQQMEAQPQ